MTINKHDVHSRGKQISKLLSCSYCIACPKDFRRNIIKVKCWVLFLFLFLYRLHAWCGAQGGAQTYNPEINI